METSIYKGGQFCSSAGGQFSVVITSMFAGPKLRITDETLDAILGELMWFEEPDAHESVRWECSEANTPSALCQQLASFLGTQDLLEIDRIQLSRQELHKTFIKHTSSGVSFPEFEVALDELEEVEVLRLENGEAFDSFYVHE